MAPQTPTYAATHSVAIFRCTLRCSPPLAQHPCFPREVDLRGRTGFATYFGGSGNEHCGGVAPDSNGNAYIAGGTYSSNFPTGGAIQLSLAGGEDAFVAKIDTSGAKIGYSTYLGRPPGSSPPGLLEQANGIAVDAAGAAYVTGVTNSAGFPVTSGSLRTAYNGAQDAFAVKINPSGSALT